jgi:hypothetical protein
MIRPSCRKILRQGVLARCCGRETLRGEAAIKDNP